MLDELINRRGVRELYETIRDMFHDNWQSVNEVPREGSLSIRLPDRDTKGRYRAYARIDPRDDGVHVRFYNAAIELDARAFQLAQDSIQSENSPSGAIIFPLTMGDWDTYGESLVELVKTLYAEWETRDANA